MTELSGGDVSTKSKLANNTRSGLFICQKAKLTLEKTPIMTELSGGDVFPKEKLSTCAGRCKSWSGDIFPQEIFANTAGGGIHGNIGFTDILVKNKE
jgi:hypothetical protein